ncbi:MAG: hypothetical protein Q8S13_09320, partial [Dehalococcoidia bacterium]|nr:hypothetical protein [Dehalococcoidia bacterium]
FGFDAPDRYFEDRIGISYRTLRRRLSVLEAIKRLPEADRPEAEAAVIALGSHKSAAIARAIGREGVDWRQLVEFAQRATAEAVQERVTIETGGKARGDPADPGERLYRQILNTVPPDLSDFVTSVFEHLMRIPEGPRNPLAALLILVHLGQAELAARGLWKE